MKWRKQTYCCSCAQRFNTYTFPVPVPWCYPASIRPTQYTKLSNRVGLSALYHLHMLRNYFRKGASRRSVFVVQSLSARYSHVRSQSYPRSSQLVHGNTCIAILLCTDTSKYDTAVLMWVRKVQLALSEFPFILLSTSSLIFGSTPRQSARPGNYKTDRHHCPAVHLQDNFSETSYTRYMSMPVHQSSCSLLSPTFSNLNFKCVDIIIHHSQSI